MAKKLTSLFLCLSILLSGFAASAQEESAEPMGPKKQLAIIVFSGLSGAILGLSTLSFYGRPQERLSNIAIGFAIGIIAGTAYTTYKAATQPRDFYSEREFVPELWAMEDARLAQGAGDAPQGLGYNWQF